MDLEQVTARHLGITMRKLRFKHGNQGGTHKKGWFVGKREVARLALSYGLHTPVSSVGANVPNVTEGHKVTELEMPQDSVQEIIEGNALAWQAQAGF